MSPTQPPPSLPGPAPEDDLRRRRLQQVLWVLIAAVAASLLTRALAPAAEPPWVLLATLLALAGALALLRAGAVAAASTAMVVVVTAMLIAQMARYQGLRDGALVGMPGVLVVVALLGLRRDMLIVLVAMMAAVVAVGVANVQGWYLNAVPPPSLSTVVDLCVILAVTAFCVSLLAGDLAGALRRLRSEVEEVRRSRSQVEYLATHDALTGLPNRLMARDRFEHAAALAQRANAKVALIYLDLDHFKTVNDSLGHPAGDKLLCSLGERLRQLLRVGDTVSRSGGDEFIILLDSVADGDAVAEVASKVLALAAAPWQVDGVDVHIGASIGIAMFPEDGGSFDALMKKADIAMYRAKQAGRGSFLFFDAAMNDSVSEHLQLVSGMRQALERGEFVLHYQPQLALDSHRVIGAEALLRWRHPVRGMVPPGRFISVAEHSGQIVEIGAWVLKEACRQARLWQEQGLPPLVMSVNLSPVQVRRGALERDVMQALQSSGLAPAMLELEFTESLLIEDSESLRATLARLRGLGVRFAIDDFGTGYSNLAYLKKFEFERLKIDQSFVRRLVDNPNDEAIVRAIVQMAGALRLGVIAEGIEDAATLERLQAIGCNEGQGFHWAPALPADEFAAFVARQVDAT